MPGRGNGLEASSYTPLTDLNPQLADAVLHALAEAGVAAYVAPASQHSAGLAVPPFRGPLERLWVDTSATSRAQEVLDARLPALRAQLEHPPGHQTIHEGDRSEGDEDSAWAAIVAGFHAASQDPVPRWPAVEDLGADTPAEPRGWAWGRTPAPDDEDNGGSGAPGLAAEGPAGMGAGLGSVGESSAGDTGTAAEEDHFVPPPPPPIPRPDGVTKAAGLALAGGPLYLLIAFVADMHVGDVGAFLAAVAFVGGFVTLVARMRDRPPTDSGPDDGAVV